VTGSSSPRYLLITLALFTALTAVMTYPQALHLHDRVHDDGDPLFETWILAWVAHQLPRAPAHLFDANMFYPERRTLAYSETLLLPGAAAAPLHWLGVHPIVVYNLVFLSGFVISGVGTALLVRMLTGSAGAGIIAGLVFAFLPYRIDHFPHLQLQQTQCLPFALWAFHRLIANGRVRDGVLFGAFVAGQVLSCMYYGLFLFPYLVVVCGVLLWSRRRRAADAHAAPEVARRSVALPLVAAAVVVAVATVPLGIAYLNARKVVGERGRQEVVDGSATLTSYLSPGEDNALYGKAFAGFIQPERQLFLGFAAMALAVVALWPPVSTTRIAYAFGGLAAFDVSLGFNGLSYRVFYDYVLPFHALRVPARMGLFVGFSVAVLAGFGIARLTRRIASSTRRRIAFAIAAVVMLIEYASRPLTLFTVQTAVPPSYADILADKGADSPTTVLFEFPTSALDDPTYLYNSTFHWQNLVNGYSGFFPPSYLAVASAVRTLPSDSSLNAIKSHNTRYLVVHGERLRGDRYDRLVADLSGRSDMRLVSRRPWFDHRKHSEIAVFRIVY